MATKAAPKKPISPAVKPYPRNTVVNLTLDRDIYNAVCDYRKSMGLSMEQDVIRIAVASFLKREGYIN